MTRKDFSEIYKILVGLDVAVPRVRTVLVLVFKTGGRSRIFIPVYRGSPFLLFHHVSSNSQILQSSPAGKVKS